MCIGWLRLRKYSYIYRVIYLIVIKMLKVVAFMKQVAKGLQMDLCTEEYGNVEKIAIQSP